MKGKLIFVFVGAIVFISIYSLDRWGQKAFIKLALSAFTPREDQKEVAKSYAMNENKSIDFPANFLIGTSSSAYQVEGGWNEDGKSPSIWDDFVHFNHQAVADGSNGDVGPDSFHFYKNDVKALKLVGFQHYRFSISWTRIISNGSVNQNGIDYYTKLIDELIANDIEPMITLFHWDIPRWLQDLGGLANPIFVDHFKAFADICFKNFGSKVKTWMTMNEPFNFCVNAYQTLQWAPAIKSPGVGEYLCGHYMLLSHAAVYRLYKEKYFDEQQGTVGITLDSRFYYAKNSKVTSKDLHRAQDYRLGWFSHPIFSKQGGYPQVMVDEIAARSKLEGRPFSRLPEMDEETKNLVRGSSDFFGLNYYTSRLLDVDRNERSPSESPAWFKDSRNIIEVDAEWKCAKSSWLFNVPRGLRDLLKWIKDEYDNPKVFITENGWSDEGELEDDGRIDYMKSHMTAISQAINEDGCDVIGYTAWSLLDSFEWNQGYTEKFGIFSVNYSSPTKERIPKKSAMFFKEFIKYRNFN